MTAYQTYRVTVRLQFPAWDEVDGLSKVVRARSKSDAIRRVRQDFEIGGQTNSQQGRKTFSAVITDDQEED